MKRRTVGYWLAAFCFGAASLAAQGSTDQNRYDGSASDVSGAVEAVLDAARPWIGPGPTHKVVIDVSDRERLDRLRGTDAVVREIDYGAFFLFVVDEADFGGRDAFIAADFPVVDDIDLCHTHGRVLDTAHPEVLFDRESSDGMFPSTTRDLPPEAGLYLIAFVGPAKDEWLADLSMAGATIVTPIERVAYVVGLAPETAAAFSAYLADHDEVQYACAWHPIFRVSAPISREIARAPEQSAMVTVQLANIDGVADSIARLRNCAIELEPEFQVGPYVNVRAVLRLSDIRAVARDRCVFAIEPRSVRQRTDERQGQILAGAVAGANVAMPGYLAFLAQEGFGSAQFQTFSVNIVDDATTLAGHADLPAARIAFAQNPTGQTGRQGGHGHLNAHIVGGFNSQTGTLYEDAAGFNYGLGIAPFARVGTTAIFGQTPSTPTAWESAAFVNGARISSNSWGYSYAFSYDSSAQEYDFITRDARQSASGNQEMCVVFAAGNDGIAQDTIGSPATAKNVITVGASENDRPATTDGCGTGPTGANDVRDIIPFSSRGPVNKSGGDGRMKPDIVAPGTHIEAGVPQSNYDGSSICDKFYPPAQTLYGWSSGTSHSCPAVAGGAALVYQDFLNAGSRAPSPAMIKAWLMNSAEYMTGSGAADKLPSPSQGMGRMHLGRALDATTRKIVDQSRVFQSTGDLELYSLGIVDPSKPVRATLVWTDAPGPVTGAPWTNDLDLSISIAGQTYRGNVFGTSQSVAGGAADKKNNCESIFLPAGLSGNFVLTVKAAGISGDGVPGNVDMTDQDFALVVFNATDVSVPPISEFSGSPTLGVAPLAVTFNDLSTGIVNSWMWDFGDGQTSTAQNPTHVFSLPGSYTVQLTVTGPGGQKTTVKGNYVSAVAPSASKIYVSFTAGTTVPGIGSVADEDIVVFDPQTGSWAFYFDGSDVGLGATDLDAFTILPNGDVAMSIDSTTFNIPGLIGGPTGPTVTDADIVVFSPTMTGSTTAGMFTFFFDGSAVGLTSTTEDVDAVFIDATGGIHLSTKGIPTVPGLSGLADEDVLLFTPTSTGVLTAGSWALEFDGSDLSLTDSTNEDIDGIDFDAQGRLYFTCTGIVSVPGFSAQDEDVVRFSGTFGPATSGSLTLAVDLSMLGIAAAADIDGIFISND